MNVALRTNIPSKMIVVDMAPVPLKLSREYSMHIEAMRDIQSRRLTKQKEADDILKQYEPDLVVRQFLLTNLKKNRSDGVYQFRIPFDILDRALGRMGQFDKLSPQQPYIGPTLFITGGKSPFRKQFIDHPDEIKAQFPNAIIENIPEAGHWGKYYSNKE
jgi:pimeloyl-ACP methyl ester carboxylesterase